MRSLLLSLYMTSLVGFSFVPHPVGCCYLLLMGSVCLGFFVYIIMGFSWYVLLFCMVYIGGVYVIYIFSSMYSPNLFTGLGLGVEFILGLFFIVFYVMNGLLVHVPVFAEMGIYLSSYGGSLGYCLFCLILLLGFTLISLLSSSKDCFFR